MNRNRVVSLFALLALLLAAPAAVAQPLRVVEVSFPEFNCLFFGGCTLTAIDSTGVFPVPGARDEGVLQSRTSARGEAGLPGGGLIPYLYRVDLRDALAITAVACVRELSFEAGPTTRVDFDGDRRQDDVFVATAGGLGSVRPTSAERVGDEIRFRFDPAVCAGESSYFFGFAARGEPVERTAKLDLTLGGPVSAAVRSPGGRPRLPGGGGGEPDRRFPDAPGCVASGLELERVPQWTNVCRCLSDASLREFRCALRHPGMVLVWNLPWIHPGEPVRLDYTAIQLDPQQPMPQLELTIPGAKRLTEQKVSLTPGEEISSGRLWFLAPDEGALAFRVEGAERRP